MFAQGFQHLHQQLVPSIRETVMRVDLQVVVLVSVALLRQPSCPSTAAGLHEGHVDQFNFGTVHA
ncbi:hypothetical protein D3C75_1118800 [compost metagenome]